MNKILVAYTTNAGSTEEVARAIADELGKSGQVDLCRLEEVSSLNDYGSVIVGAPMILGWSRPALRFLKRHRQELSSRQVACFCTLMSLTQTHQDSIEGVPVYIDPNLPAEPKNPRRLGIKESYATVSNYLRPLLKAAPSVKPVSIAMFGGKMEMFRLKWWQALFVMIIIQARPGDLRNWEAIRSWAKGLNLG